MCLISRIYTLIFLLIIFSSAYASDFAYLDALQKNGVITQAEADYIAKSMVSVEPLRKNTQTLELSSRIQVQYEYLNSEMCSDTLPSPSGRQGFLLRRIFLEADADVGAGWSAHFGVDLARNSVKSLLLDNYLAKNIDGEFLNGTVYFGFMKPQFIFEEITSSASLYTIERSPTTLFWSGEASNTRLGVGNRYAGVRFNGNIMQIDGLSYVVSITNSYQLAPELTAYNANTKFIDNHLAYWFSLHQEIKGDDWRLKFGAYSMYSASGNRDNCSEIYSINPYITANYGGLNMWVEYVASRIEKGKVLSNGSRGSANPYGMNFGIEYRFDVGDWGQIAPVFRYSWLDTNGRGMRNSDGVRQAPNVSGAYNEVQDFYIGVNWYLNGDDLKIQLGYDIAHYSGAIPSSVYNGASDSHALRIQLQVKL